MPIERLQAPSGGINSDASPDYVGGTEAADLINLLPGLPGKVARRGQFFMGLGGYSSTAARPDAFWSWDDFFIAKGNPGGGTKVWRSDASSGSPALTDVTATLVESPLDYRYVRFGVYTYGAIVDAASPQLGKWDGGATAILPMANAPFQWTDLQVHAERLFILGGSVPGTTTPVNARTLYWTDPGGTADLSLLASWQDDVSGLTNQINYQSDDTPVGLAGCGKYLAVIGSRSINILTGTGTASFAIRNLTRNLGCSDINSIVELDDGFYFMSDRGFCFCDGTTVTVVSDQKVSQALLSGGGFWTTAVFNDGYVGLCSNGSGICWLYHTLSKAWTKITMDIGSTTPQGVFRTLTYPIVWQSGGYRRAELVTRTDTSGIDHATVAFPTVKTTWRSRFVRLGSPGQMVQIQRLMFEHIYFSSDTAGWQVQIVDTLGNVLVTSTPPTQNVSASQRSRFQVGLNSAEADAVQIVVTMSGTLGAITAEIYDAYFDFLVGRDRPTI